MISIVSHVAPKGGGFDDGLSTLVSRPAPQLGNNRFSCRAQPAV
jgi:hypothetical protein